MKVCYFIQAHKYPELVCRLVRTIKRSSPRSVVVLYLDSARCQINMDHLQDLSEIYVLKSKHRLIWTHYSNQVKPYLDVVDWLFTKNVKFDWLINITGQCYPTQSLSCIEEFLSKTPYDGFIRYWDIDSKKCPWSKEEVFRRYYQRYWLTSRTIYNFLHYIHDAGLMKPFIKFRSYPPIHEYRVGLEPAWVPFGKEFVWYGGYAWFTLSRRAVQYLRDFAKKNLRIMRYYKHTVIPEESWAQTILLNNKSFNLCNDDKLYIDYSGSRDGHSNVLTIKDYDTITNGNYHFARKFDLTVDPEILDLLDKKIFEESWRTFRNCGKLLKLLMAFGIKKSKNVDKVIAREFISRVDQIPCRKRQEWFRKIKWLFRFHRLDSDPIPNKKSELRLFMCIRNESVRLPYLFKYYRSKGVDRFFVVDNNSNDDSKSFLLSQNNTHVFETKASYGNSGWGTEWIRHLLDLYGQDHWCLAIDADEFLIYPHWEKSSIKDLVSYLDDEGATALPSFLLDMYSDKPLKDTLYARGEDPLKICSFFDYDQDCLKTFLGGMRKRVFGLDDVSLSKVCLFKYAPHCWVNGGMHSVVGFKSADINGGVLHFKYFSDFYERAVEEVKRKEHWLDAAEYKNYAEKAGTDPNFALWHPDSKKFIDSEQLVKIGLMKSSGGFNRYVQDLRNTE